MKTLNYPTSAKPFSVLRSCTKHIALFAIAVFLGMALQAQNKACRDCSVPSFGTVSIYHIAQPHSDFGFGFEAGKWNKDDSRFSYFMGAKLEWFRLDPNSAKYNNTSDNIHFTVYMKGQFEIMNRLYVVASPEFVNLSSFDLQSGIRYVFPVSNSIGIGVEPAYSIVQKQYALNTNIHIALW